MGIKRIGSPLNHLRTVQNAFSNLVACTPAKVCVCFLPALLTGLLWNSISLPYANPEGIVGPLSLVRFHPANNILRYVLFVTGPGLVWLMLGGCKIKAAQVARTFTSRVSGAQVLGCLAAAGLLVLAQLLLTYAPFPCIPCEDIFHLGEKTVPALVYRDSGRIWTGTVFPHGALYDLFISYWSWLLTGSQGLAGVQPLWLVHRSLGIAGFAIFLACTAVALWRDHSHPNVLSLLLLLSTGFYWGHQRLFTFSGRDVIPLLGFGIIFVAVSRGLPWLWGLVGLLSPVAFFHSIDRGAYFTLVAGVAVLLSGYLGTGQKTKNRALLYWGLGIIAGWAVGAMLLGLTEARAFLDSLLFWVRNKDYLDSFVYPSPFDTSLWTHILPLWFLMLSIFYFATAVGGHRGQGKVGTATVHLVVVLAAFFFYRNAMGRSDDGHILYSVQFAFFALVLQGWLIWQKVGLGSRWLARSSITLTGLSLLCAAGSVYGQRHSLADGWRLYQEAFRLEEGVFLNQSHRRALPLLAAAFEKQDCVFVLPSEPGWYLYLNKPPCTPFYITWFAAPPRFQRRVIRDLRERKPEKILYSSPDWYNLIDGIPAERRLPELVSFLRESYEPWKEVEGYWLYRLKEVTPPE